MENLHQPQYVEKLERLIRFLCKYKALNSEQLDLLWSAQAGNIYYSCQQVIFIILLYPRYILVYSYLKIINGLELWI